MPIRIVRDDITRMRVDAVVSAANRALEPAGGVDGEIHRAAGPGLAKECRRLGGCEKGEAKLTRAYRLPCRYVIHTVGPAWIDGRHGERETLVRCYLSALTLARDAGCAAVAFPLISTGVLGYPKDEALRVAVDTISGFLADCDMTVYIVVFDRASYAISAKLFSDIEEYIDDRYADEHADTRSRRFIQLPNAVPPPVGSETFSTGARGGRAEPLSAPEAKPAASLQKRPAFGKARKLRGTLDDALKQIDESFSEMLLRKIDESGMTDAQCYKKANIDRKLFSKIRGDRLYKPSKPTALAFAIALELPLEETKELLMKAGFALSHSSKFDIIIEYFIEHGNYNIFEINEALFAFDQSLLGA